MKKNEFFNYLTEDKAQELMAKVADAFSVSTTDPSFKLLRIAPLDDEDIDLLVEFKGTPELAQIGIDQANKAREIIEEELGEKMDFVEMVPYPKRDRLTGKVTYEKILAWFKFKN